MKYYGLSFDEIVQQAEVVTVEEAATCSCKAAPLRRLVALCSAYGVSPTPVKWPNGVVSMVPATPNEGEAWTRALFSAYQFALSPQGRGIWQ